MLFGHRSRSIFVLLLSQWFKSVEFVFMQDSAHRAKTTLSDLRNVVPDFAVEKTSSSIAAVTKQHGDQFSTFSVECLVWILITLCVFFVF